MFRLGYHCVILIIFCAVQRLTFSENDLQNELLEGARQYEELSQRVIKYGSCWKSAIKELHIGCRQLTEEVQSRLALDFANCFLENSGSNTCECSTERKVSDCLSKADDRIFSTYREFYTHTRSICYFLQHQVWQENTENTIKKLSSSSEKVSQQLENSTKSQEAILHLQEIALVRQQHLIRKSETGLQNLNVELEKSRSSARAVLEEFKSTAEEQNLWFSAVYNHIKKLEALVIGELTGFYTFIYYSVAIILTYILTAARQTSEARVWLYFIVSLNAFLEKVIAEYSLDEETEESILLNPKGPINCRIWLCRKGFCVICFFILAVKAYRFQDYNKINNHLLLDIQKQYREIQEFIQENRTKKSTPRISRSRRQPAIHSNELSRNEVVTSTPISEHFTWPWAVIRKIPELVIFNQNSAEKLKHEESIPVFEQEDSKVLSPKKKKQAVRRNSSLYHSHKDDENSAQSFDEVNKTSSPSGRYNLRARVGHVTLGSSPINSTSGPLLITREILTKATRETKKKLELLQEQLIQQKGELSSSSA